jgi:hypothetical protein
MSLQHWYMLTIQYLYGGMNGLCDAENQVQELAWWDLDVLARANIVPATGLATDYLNVFNEAVMLFDLLPDMPDMIEELLVWQPLTYEQHFGRSTFQAKELAILAYQNCGPSLKAPFDALSDETGIVIARAIVTAQEMMASGASLADFVAKSSITMHAAIMMLDRMVHGGNVGGEQDDIDALFD